MRLSTAHRLRLIRQRITENRRTAIRVAFVLVAFLLLLPKATPLFAHLLDRGSEVDEVTALSVDAVSPQPGTVYERITTTGNIVASAAVSLSAETSGRVVGIYLREGAAVSRGQLLVKINDSELRARLQRAEFSLELMRDTEQRQRRLLEIGGTSREEYNAIREELNDLESEVELIQAQIATTEIRAPFDGVLGLRYIDEGAYISPSTRIATLQDLRQVRIDFSIPERYSAHVAPGDTINFRVQGVDTSFSGVIHAVEPEIDRRTRTAQVRAISDNPGQLLRPGAFASVDVVIEAHEDALMIPTTALIPGQAGYSVYVVRSDRAIATPVQIGMRTNNLVHITDGLSPGDIVLTTGLLHVQDGSSVHVRHVEPIFPQRQVESIDDPIEEDYYPIVDDVPLAAPDEEADDFPVTE